MKHSILASVVLFLAANAFAATQSQIFSQLSAKLPAGIYGPGKLADGTACRIRVFVAPNNYDVLMDVNDMSSWDDASTPAEFSMAADDAKENSPGSEYTSSPEMPVNTSSEMVVTNTVKLTNEPDQNFKITLTKTDKLITVSMPSTELKKHSVLTCSGLSDQPQPNAQ